MTVPVEQDTPATVIVERTTTETIEIPMAQGPPGEPGSGLKVIKFPFDHNTPGLGTVGVPIGYTASPGDYILQVAFVVHEIWIAPDQFSQPRLIFYIGGQDPDDSNYSLNATSLGDVAESSTQPQIVGYGFTDVQMVTATVPLMLTMWNNGAQGRATLIVLLVPTGIT